MNTPIKNEILTQVQFNLLKKQALHTKNSALEERVQKIKKIKSWIKKNQQQIIEALQKDFEKNSFETLMTEISVSLKECDYYLSNLPELCKIKKVKTPLTLVGHESYIYPEGKGVVLVISPWNYPFNLALLPLIAALAAGNTVCLKPSEVTPHTSALIAELTKSLFNENEVLTIQGGKDTTQNLLNFDFDHVFFTGSTQVGRIIAEACAKKLIPFTLELGGKSPVVVDETCDIQDTAEKLFWGKFLNRGQTCVAPDYILVQENVYEKLKLALQQLINTCSEKPTGFIHEGHLNRLITMSGLDQLNEKPCAFVEIKSIDHPLMKEEIFGPVAPLLSYKNLDEAIHLIQLNPYPLALYIFSQNQNNINKIIKATQSGGVCVNTLIIHLANEELPFGGIRTSGIGKYHGKFGFDELTHQRAVLKQTWLKKTMSLLYPPYTELKKNLLSKL